MSRPLSNDKVAQTCDHPGCAAGGIYPAPQSRAALRSYYWFCLEHIRAYNATWNYFAGMDDDEIEYQIRRDTVWERPSWPFAGLSSDRGQPRFRDPFGCFDEDRAAAGGHARRNSAEAKAMAVLEVAPPVTSERLKARYKELVKQHHPDTNGGDKAAEERLKEINAAYSTLKSSVSA